MSSRILLVVSLAAMYFGWAVTLEKCYQCFSQEPLSGKEVCEISNLNKSECEDGSESKSCFTLAYDYKGNMTYVRDCSDLPKDKVCDILKDTSTYTVKQCNACDEDGCNTDKFE